MLIRFAEWAKALPAGVNPTFARLLADRPEDLAVSCVGGAFGIALVVCGYVAWPVVMGRNNSPSKKIWLTLGGLPIALGVVGTFLTLAKAGPTSLFAAPLMLGATFALVPFIVGLMALGLLQFALNFVGPTPQSCTAEELPADVAEYFNGFDSAAAAANLESLGDAPIVTPPPRVAVTPYDRGNAAVESYNRATPSAMMDLRRHEQSLCPRARRRRS